MTRIHLRFLVVGVAVLAAAAAAAAQTPAAPVLNQVEVTLLVARAEPGDHATLSGHFAALADRYASDARRHNAMAQAAGGNPNRANHSTSAHCTRLAELNEQAAATLRDLANHHERLASGIPSFVPRDAARFEEG